MYEYTWEKEEKIPHWHHPLLDSAIAESVEVRRQRGSLEKGDYCTFKM
jgi:hypothetical protein